MSEMHLIETALKRAERRRRWERAWRGAWQGLLAGGLIWLTVQGVYKLLPIPRWSLAAGAIAAGSFALIGLIVGLWRKASLPETARWVDRRKGLQERLGTALEFSGSSGAQEWKELILQDAARHAKEIDPRLLTPIRLT